MKWFEGFVAEIEKGFTFRHEIARKEQLEKTTINFKHAHSRYEAYYLISGNVNYTVAGRVYHINPGDVLVINAFTLHGVEVLPTCDYERYVLEFTSSNIPVINGINPISRFFNTNEFINIIPGEIVAQSKFVEMLHNMESNYDPNDEYANHILYGEITKLVVELAKLFNKRQNVEYNYIKSESKNSDVINKIIQCINTNINQEITIDFIAKEVGYSRSYMQHEFKEIVGMSISQYILSQKMQTANFLLLSGTPMQEVSDGLGYKYYSTFSATYKKFFGYSPKERKKQEK